MSNERKLSEIPAPLPGSASDAPIPKVAEGSTDGNGRLIIGATLAPSGKAKGVPEIRGKDVPFGKINDKVNSKFTVPPVSLDSAIVNG